ncbi:MULTISPECIES: cytochrome P450 [unclassified Phyllobacterium]|uniref:cytochrome P450 n=1 Tax=unclassified Phyllobacterium TaxID=2638441 RepID=UPI003012F9A2
MLFSNDTTHRHRRGPMTPAFAFKMIAEIRPQIRALADKILREGYADGQMDFLQTYASSIPARTIAAIFGIPDSDISRFTRSIYTIAKAIGASWSAKDLPEIDQAVVDMHNYVEELLADRRRNPRNDFLSEYIGIVERQGVLTSFEAITQIITIVLGGSDTTRMAMAMQVCLLLEHPEQWNAIVEDRGLIPNAVLESLRFEPSVASIPRFTVEDIEIDGHFIPKDQPIALSTMSAMRDAAIYPAGDTFDIRRTHPKWHLVFGSGAHRCIGEALAKAELEEGLAALVEIMPSLRLVGPRPIASGFAGIRSVTDMTVEW